MRLEAGPDVAGWTVMDEEPAQYSRALLRDGRPYADGDEVARATIQAAHVMIEPKHKMIYIIH